ncbi:YciI family protein [Variovorax sp. J22R133]|uniref:YciI family protein n=1 Tax=Variovorax brevis TaxID=3053503 RepID=UPI002578A138|nr:YciI family protein [Variovorax sp. J22R133]MDM0117819.1 YciI family protein [Variovorax sp. J22R133]
MPFAIITLDKPDRGDLRTRIRSEHVAYLDARKHLMLAGGAMLDENSSPHGGIILIETEDRAVAEDFAANDPFNKAGLFEEVKVVRWRKSFFQFENLISS